MTSSLLSVLIRFLYKKRAMLSSPLFSMSDTKPPGCQWGVTRSSRLVWNPVGGLIWVLISLLGASDLFAAQISDAIKSSIQRRVDYGYNPGIVIGLINASGRDFYGYGSLDLESQQTPDEHTFYEIGSVTKVFTTSLLAEMVDRGDVTLDTPVASLLPDATSVPSLRGVEITLLDLATHFSGLPNNPPKILENDPLNPFAPFATSDLYELLETEMLTHTPGTHYEYSNLGLGLLGFALSEKLALPYGEALRERILSPLGLQDTGVTLSPGQSSRRAQGYQGVLKRAPFAIETIDAAGILLSTANDMLTFLEHQLDLKESPLNDVFQEAHRARHNLGSPEQNIGLGWILLRLGPDTITMHDGATLGHNAFAGFNAGTKRGVVVLSNARLNKYAAVQDLGIKELAPNFPLSPIRRPASVSVEQLRRLPGHYEGEDETSFSIRIENEHLIVGFSQDRGAEFTLYPVSANRFNLYEASIEATAVFGEDSNGEIVSVQWRQGGETGNFTRVRRAPNLTLNAANGTLSLSLSGEADRTYLIESSHDLIEWTPLVERSIWESPWVLSSDTAPGARYFRVLP